MYKVKKKFETDKSEKELNRTIGNTLQLGLIS